MFACGVIAVDEGKMTSIEHHFSVEKYLDSGLLTDVVLNVRSEMFPEVPERKFRCHKLFLAMRNDVFYSMFYGGLAEEGPVNIVDVHPDGFNVLLRYLYSGKATLKAIEEALHARAAARKYLVSKLVEGCTDYIKRGLSASNICAYLNYYGATQEPERDTAALNVVLTGQANNILLSETFIVAQEYTIDFILSSISSPLHSRHRIFKSFALQTNEASGLQSVCPGETDATGTLRRFRNLFGEPVCRCKRACA
ncbi:BTB/POZ domain-containing protein 6-like [Haemaphysalis longicornis]